MSDQQTKYVIGRSERAIFSEIYFPKHAAHQGPIFNALRHGYSEEDVKRYLRDNARELLEELGDYQALDPHRYQLSRPKRRIPPLDEALQRIDMYKSPFKGWSMYSVDGVFFDQKCEPIEEATQVVRIMFRFTSSCAEQAEAAGCGDVLRAILFWVISRQGRIGRRAPWERAEQAAFLQHHQQWSKQKRAFVQKHFADIVKEIGKWMNDCALFVFGYLVRRFTESVLAEKMLEEEIWVTSFFNLTLNVVQRSTEPIS